MCRGLKGKSELTTDFLDFFDKAASDLQQYEIQYRDTVQ